MSTVERIKNVERRFAFGVIGVLVGLVGISIAIWGVLHENKPEICFEITNEANVLDVRTPLKDLTISFQGEDIQKKNLNLRIFTIRIENTGRVDILQDHYDQKLPWGFRVQNGKIIEVRLVDSNSDYLKSNLNPQLFGEDAVQFAKVIFERTRFFTLEILVLHTKYNLPDMKALGKIAGIGPTIPIKAWSEKERPTFVRQLFHGNVMVQILRLIIYFCAGFVLILIIGFPGIKISELRSKKKKESRRRKVAQVLGRETLEEGSKEKKLLDIYVDGGLASLERLKTLLDDEDRLLVEIQKDKLWKEYNKKRAELEKRKPLSDDIAEPPAEMVMRNGDVRYIRRFPRRAGTVSDLVESGVLTLGGDNKVQIDQEFERALKDLLRYLEPKERNRT